MNLYLLQENGGKILLEDKSGALIIGRRNTGGGRMRKRRSLMEGGANFPSIDDTAQRRKLAQRNAAIMVALH